MDMMIKVGRGYFETEDLTCVSMCLKKEITNDTNEEVNVLEIHFMEADILKLKGKSKNIL